MRIAIVGSGIAGLTASHLLARNGHEVRLYESQSQIGMSAQTVEFAAEAADGSSVFGDVPSRMFNVALWPNVVKLYQTLGIATAPVDATQSYRRSDEKLALQLEMPFRWTREIISAATSTASSFLSPVRTGNFPESHSLKDRRRNFLTEMTRLRDQGQRDLGTLDPMLRFSDYLREHEFSSKFCETFLFPALSSTVCTCSHAAIKDYPAVILLDAMRHISGDQRLSRVVAGSRSVADKLIGNATEVRLATRVTSIEDAKEFVSLTAGGNRERFDHVVVATQANHVSKICPGLNDDEVETIEAFRYEDVEVLVHTDQRFMPVEGSQWSSFNFVASDQNDESMCTVWMNRFHSDWMEAGHLKPIFQTIRPIHKVHAERLIGRAKLQRPVVDLESWQLWQRLSEFHRQPDRRIWFCGSYAKPGIPLLESGVSSGIEIANSISNR